MKNFKYFILAVVASVVAISCSGGGEDDGGLKAGGKIKELKVGDRSLFSFTYNALGQVTDVAVKDNIDEPAVDITVTRAASTLTITMSDASATTMVLNLNAAGYPVSGTYAGEYPIAYTYSANGQLEKVDMADLALDFTYANRSLTKISLGGNDINVKTSKYQPLCVPDVNSLLFAADLVLSSGLADTAPFIAPMLLGLMPSTGNLFSEMEIQTEMDYTDPANPVPVIEKIPVEPIMDGARLNGAVYKMPEDVGGDVTYKFSYM